MIGVSWFLAMVNVRLHRAAEALRGRASPRPLNVRKPRSSPDTRRSTPRQVRCSRKCPSAADVFDRFSWHGLIGDRFFSRRWVVIFDVTGTIALVTCVDVMQVRFWFSHQRPSLEVRKKGQEEIQMRFHALLRLESCGPSNIRQGTIGNQVGDLGSGCQRWQLVFAATKKLRGVGFFHEFWRFSRDRGGTRVTAPRLSSCCRSLALQLLFGKCGGMGRCSGVIVSATSPGGRISFRVLQSMCTVVDVCEISRSGVWGVSFSSDPRSSGTVVKREELSHFLNTRTFYAIAESPQTLGVGSVE